MELYLQLKRDYKPAEYLSCVKDHKLRKTLTKYRLSDHGLAIERGRHRQRWQPQEQRLCSLCSQKELETEEHFLLHCDYYHHIRAAYLPKFKLIQTNFMALPNADKLRHILGENSKTICISLSQTKTVSQWTNLKHHRFFHVVQSLCVCICVCVCIYIYIYIYIYVYYVYSLYMSICICICVYIYMYLVYLCLCLSLSVLYSLSLSIYLSLSSLPPPPPYLFPSFFLKQCLNIFSWLWKKRKERCMYLFISQIYSCLCII